MAAAPAISDDLLVQRAAGPRSSADAREAFTLLYDRYARQVLPFLAARVPGNVLEDLHQDVWQRAWEKLPTHFRGGNFRAWLFEIARNRVFDYLRQPQRYKELDPNHPVADLDLGPEELLDHQELRQRLQQCIAKLSEERRSVVVARLAGQSPEQIAQGLGIARATVDTRWHRACHDLRTCLGVETP